MILTRREYSHMMSLYDEWDNMVDDVPYAICIVDVDEPFYEYDESIFTERQLFHMKSAIQSAKLERDNS